MSSDAKVKYELLILYFNNFGQIVQYQFEKLLRARTVRYSSNGVVKIQRVSGPFGWILVEDN